MRFTYFPKDGIYNNKEFSFKLNYRKDGNAIILEKEYILNFFTLLEDKIPEWNNMIKALNKKL